MSTYHAPEAHGHRTRWIVGIAIALAIIAAIVLIVVFTGGGGGNGGGY